MKKIVVDILLLLLLVTEFSKLYFTSFIHELVGLLLLVVVIIHLILNRNYLKNIFKGKYNFNRLILLLVNVGMFLSMILSIIFGIMVSQSIFKSISSFNLGISRLHYITSYLSLLLVGIHLGLNLNQIKSKMSFFNNKIVCYIIDIIVIVYGIYSFIKVDFIGRITGNNILFMIETNVVFNYMRYLSLILMFSIITYLINKIIVKNRSS